MYFLYEFFGYLSTVYPPAKEPRMNPGMYPKEGWKIYQIPPPLENMGRPISPKTMYINADQADFLPKSIAPRQTKSICIVKGTPGRGTLMKAPTAMRAVKSPQRTVSFVEIFLVCIIFTP